MGKNWKNLENKLLNLFLIFFCFFSFSYERSDNYVAHEVPKDLENLGIKENLGKVIDLNLSFLNEESESVFLKDYFYQSPVLMTIIYYNCPSLCNFHLNGLFKGLEKISLKSGQDYQLVVVSMDASEKPSLAKKKKNNYLKKFTDFNQGVHFLTGSEGSIQKLASQLGFSFRWDEETEQFAHSPVAYVLSPQSLISRYLYGVEFDSSTLKMALIEAGQGKIGNIVDRILLFCYRFNSGKNRYTLYAYNIMRLGGALTVMLLLFFLVSFWMKEKKGKI